MSRELTKMEKAAVDRLEEALAAIPDTLAIYFESEGHFHVFDKRVWNKGPGRGDIWGSWAQDESSDARPIGCRFDVGAF
jgi:hypothetical protein